MIDDMTQYQNHIASWLGIILGFSFTLIYAALSKILRKQALKNIQEKLEPNEYIVYEAKFLLIPDLLTPFFTGGFLGEYIIPFIIFPEIQRIDTIDRQYLPLCILAELICLFIALYICSWKPVYTNKRFIMGFGIKFYYKLKGIFYYTEYLFYKDVVSFRYQNDFFFRALYMKKKDNKSIRIGYCTNKKEIEKYVKEQLIINGVKEEIKNDRPYDTISN